MHQSIQAALPPGLLRGICPPCQSVGWGICKFCGTRGPGICQARGHSRAFDTHGVSYQNITTQRVLLRKKVDWLISQEGGKIEQGFKGMFLIFMHAFPHCLSSQNYIAKLGAIDVSQRFLVIESNFC